LNLYKFEIPIPDYEGKDVFYQCVYFQSQRCPTQEQVIEYAKKQHEIEMELYPEEYDYSWDHVRKSVEKCKDFPILSGNCVQRNGYTPTPWATSSEPQRILHKGESPLTLYRVTVAVLLD